MKKLLLLGIVLLICAVSSDMAGAKPKKLKKNKWVTVFDGTSFDGWRGYNKTGVPPKWIIEDGAMKITTTGRREGTEGGGDLIYAIKLHSFEIELEWKVSEENANSGLFFYGIEIPGEPIYVSAPEYQIVGNAPGVNPKHLSASLYDLIPAEPQNGSPIGEWNKAKIVVNNGKVEHWQNDAKVVEYTIRTPEWKAMLDNSKFSERRWPLAYKHLINIGGDNQEGYFGIQDHGDHAWYRNVRIKILD